MQLNNPKAIPNLKEPNWKASFKEKYMKHLLPLDILHIWDCLAHIIKIIEFAGLTTRFKHLLNVVIYVT